MWKADRSELGADGALALFRAACFAQPPSLYETKPHPYDAKRCHGAETEDHRRIRCEQIVFTDQYSHWMVAMAVESSKALFSFAPLLPDREIPERRGLRVIYTIGRVCRLFVTPRASLSSSLSRRGLASPSDPPPPRAPYRTTTGRTRARRDLSARRDAGCAAGWKGLQLA